MFETHPKTSQTLARRAQHARQAQALTYTPREQEILHARRILEAGGYTPQELDAMQPVRLIRDAEAFEDAYGQARTGLGN